jgi:hypothetical protein
MFFGAVITGSIIAGGLEPTPFAVPSFLLSPRSVVAADCCPQPLAVAVRVRPIADRPKFNTAPAAALHAAGCRCGRHHVPRPRRAATCSNERNRPLLS